MRTILIINILILAFLASGCTTYYQYRSDGEVQSSNGDTQNAVLYWHGEEGRLWYGKKYSQLDSGINMRICGVGAKSFDLSDDDRLELLAKSNDLRLADVDQEGELQMMDQPRRLRVGDYCGLILVDGQAATTRRLRENSEPSIAILCKSVRNPDRYPEANIYQFNIISRYETSKDSRTAPDPCEVLLR